MKSLLAAGVLALGACLALASGSRAAHETSVGYYDPAWSPDGKLIAFTDRGDTNGDLYLMKADGSDVHKLTNSTGNAVGQLFGAAYPTWSPDSKKIAFRYGPGSIFVMNVDGTGLHRIIRAGCCPDWSRSGRRIAFVSGRETGPGSIWVVRPDGTGRTLVATQTDGLDCSLTMPAWSPTGQRMIFLVGGVECAPRLGVISQYRGRIGMLLTRGVPTDPDWAPGGRRVAFSGISIYDLKTGKQITLHGGEHPRWSPNSRRLVFSYHGAIYVMSADGTGLEKLYPR